MSHPGPKRRASAGQRPDRAPGLSRSAPVFRAQSMSRPSSSTALPCFTHSLRALTFQHQPFQITSQRDLGRMVVPPLLPVFSVASRRLNPLTKKPLRLPYAVLEPASVTPPLWVQSGWVARLHILLLSSIRFSFSFFHRSPTNTLRVPATNALLKAIQRSGGLALACCNSFR